MNQIVEKRRSSRQQYTLQIEVFDCCRACGLPEREHKLRLFVRRLDFVDQRSRCKEVHQQFIFVIAQHVEYRWRGRFYDQAPLAIGSLNDQESTNG